MEAQLATKEGETPFSATTQTGRKGTVLSEAGQTEGDGQHKMSLTRGIQKTNRSRRRLTDTVERLVAGGGSWEEGRWRQSSGRDAEGHGKQAWCSAHTGKATAPTLEVTRDTRAQVKPRRAHTREDTVHQIHSN